MVDVTSISRDLNAKQLTVVGSKNGSGSDLVVAYTNEFNGKPYFHIRTVWQDDHGKWCPGEGLSVDPANAKSILTALGQAAVAF